MYLDKDKWLFTKNHLDTDKDDIYLNELRYDNRYM